VTNVVNIPVYGICLLLDLRKFAAPNFGSAQFARQSNYTSKKRQERFNLKFSYFSINGIGRFPQLKLLSQTWKIVTYNAEFCIPPTCDFGLFFPSGNVLRYF
jgi:hypothetical protein